MFLRSPLLLAAALTALAVNVEAAVLRVSEVAELTRVAKELKPGDTVLLASGEWKDLQLRIIGKGTAKAPITVRAEEPGKAVVTGSSSIAIAGEYLVVADLHFRGVIPPGDGNGIVVFDGSAKIAAAHSRLTNCLFDRCNPPDPATRYPWVKLSGTENRVDHCRFEGMNHSGVTLQVTVPKADPRHQIDHNYFLDRPRGDGNGFEGIQVGQSQDSQKDARCTIESNLFEQCDGETEIVSIKTGRNVVRGNVFLRSDGTLTLRHGRNSIVEGNHFIGEGKKGAGGIRIIDSGHRVTGNYFSGLEPVTGGIVVFYCGIPKSPLNGYFPADNVLVEGNTFTDCKGPIFELKGGYGQRNRTIIPRKATIRGNTVSPSEGAPTIFSESNLTDLVLEGNIARTGSALGRENPAGFEFRALAELTPVAPPVSAKDVGPDWMR